MVKATLRCASSNDCKIVINYIFDQDLYKAGVRLMKSDYYSNTIVLKAPVRRIIDTIVAMANEATYYPVYLIKIRGRDEKT